MTEAPRVLVTGFEPFPGAPVNPTEWLVAALQKTTPEVPGMGAFRAEVLPVDYATVADRLSGLGLEFQPDIAVHFGLAQSCSGFRLERVARNVFIAPRPDNAGVVPAAGPICPGPELLPSSLPLEKIYRALLSAGLPAEWSDDAGGYLCNVVFTLSAAGGAAGFHPSVSGFVHVPLLSQDAFDERALFVGATLILKCCVSEYLSAIKNGPL